MSATVEARHMEAAAVIMRRWWGKEGGSGWSWGSDSHAGIAQALADFEARGWRAGVEAAAKVADHWARPGPFSLDGQQETGESIARGIRALRDAPPASAEPVLDSNRCAVCGWQLAESREKGCVRGECSHRPPPQVLYDPERAYREGWRWRGTCSSAACLAALRHVPPCEGAERPR